MVAERLSLSIQMKELLINFQEIHKYIDRIKSSLITIRNLKRCQQKLEKVKQDYLTLLLVLWV